MTLKLFGRSWYGPLVGTGGTENPQLKSKRGGGVGDEARAAGLSPLASEDAVIAFVGLSFEARIAAGPGIQVVCRNAECDLDALLALAANDGCRRIISFGVAGGLAPDLRPGDCIVASAIVDSRTSRPTDREWSRKLMEMVPGARHAPVAGVAAAVAHPAAKRELHAQTGAVAVDMESHLVARAAAEHGMAFAAVRVVIDPAHRAVPEAAVAAMDEDGSTDVKALLRELIARPSQLSGMVRIASDAYAARAALMKLRRTLGPGFGFTPMPMAVAARAARLSRFINFINRREFGGVNYHAR